VENLDAVPYNFSLTLSQTCNPSRNRYGPDKFLLLILILEKQQDWIYPIGLKDSISAPVVGSPDTSQPFSTCCGGRIMALIFLLNTSWNSSVAGRFRRSRFALNQDAGVLVTFKI